MNDLAKPQTHHALEKNKSRFTGLQVGRGIAALAVVLYHANAGAVVFYGKAFSGFWEFGSIGVDFFFVLSGFIIYWSHSLDNENYKSAKTYLSKRLIRVYPPFILISLILLVSYKFLPSLSEGDRAIGIITSILLIPTPPLSPAVAVSWTLMHEMLFYIIFMTIYINKKVLHALLITWAILIILVTWSSLNGTYKEFLFSPYNLEFLLGIIAAIITRKNKGNYFQLITGITMIIFYIIYFDEITNSDNTLNKLSVRLYLGFAFMFIVIGLCSIDNYIKYPKLLVYIGTASYSIYLTHSPVLSILNRVAQKLDIYNFSSPNVIYILIVTFALTIGFLYYVLWEQPVFKFLSSKLRTQHNLPS